MPRKGKRMNQNTGKQTRILRTHNIKSSTEQLGITNSATQSSKRKHSQNYEGFE